MTDFDLEFEPEPVAFDEDYCFTCEGKGELTEDDDWDTVECPDCGGLGY